MLYQKDLPVNFNKTMTYKSNLEPLNVHGLRVNYKEPRLPQHEVSNIRAAVKRLESLVQNDKLVREYLRDMDTEKRKKRKKMYLYGLAMIGIVLLILIIKHIH